MLDIELQDMSLHDLIEHYKANNILLKYFGNQAQMLRYEIDESAKKSYKEACDKHNKCSGLETKLIKEIENRLFS